MRWFIVFLIVANIILFVWVKQQSRTSPDSSALPPPDIGHLRLSSEVEEASQAVDPIMPPDRPADTDPVTPDESDAPASPVPVPKDPEPEVVTEVIEPEPDVPVTEAAASTDEQEADSASAVDPTGVREEAETTTPVVVEPVATEPAPPQPAEAVIEDDPPVVTQQSPDEQTDADAAPEPDETVSAVSEAAVPAPVQDSAPVQTAEPAAAEEQAAVEEEPAPQVPPAVCARVGPFEPADADRAVSSLPADTELLEDVSEDYARVDRYYVLIPPLPSRTEGRRMVERLAEAGFTDTWLFPSGEYRNAISMGYFSRESGARRHAANIAKKGFNTEVRERTKVRQRRWLVLKRSAGEDPGSGLKLPEGVGVEPQACP